MFSFDYDVFVSASSSDIEMVSVIGKFLEEAGLKVYIPSRTRGSPNSISPEVENALECSRTMLLCVSPSSIGVDWLALENSTLRFRDPSNPDRRFLILKLGSFLINPIFANSPCVEWTADDGLEKLRHVVEACRPPAISSVVDNAVNKPSLYRQIKLSGGQIFRAFEIDFERNVLIAGLGGRVPNSDLTHSLEAFDLKTGDSILKFGIQGNVENISLSYDRKKLLAATDQEIQVCDAITGKLLKILNGHYSQVWGVAWNSDSNFALSSSFDGTIRLWDVNSGKCARIFEGHANRVRSVRWSKDDKYFVSCGDDNEIRLWDVTSGACLRVFRGHSYWVMTVEWTADGKYILSGSCDNTMRMWDISNGQCVHIFEGHLENVEYISIMPGGGIAATGSPDNTVCLWNLNTGNRLNVLKIHGTFVRSVCWSRDGKKISSGSIDGHFVIWDYREILDVTHKSSSARSSISMLDQIQYTNAKVLLVGESSAGKTGLSKVLAGQTWGPSDSTVGAWATQWQLPLSSSGGVEREIWLWDFGGQADQRLIHQLYMDETAVAVLVFDGQKDDVLETLAQWDRDLSKNQQRNFAKILVAGRIDAGGLRISRKEIAEFARAKGYSHFIETSAKSGAGCEELKAAIISSIPWENLPSRTTLLLFKKLKEEIVRLKDSGRTLMRFNELRDTLTFSLSVDSLRFTDEQLRAVLTLMAGPGVVWELNFGGWILLQPERINSYAQAVIHTMRADEHERGCLLEEKVLGGSLAYHGGMERLVEDDERFVLLAMLQTLVQRGLCVREHTEVGTILIFPSFYRREREKLVGEPSVLVSYRFEGYLDSIYSTLVVRLHHTKPFKQQSLWRYAADFRTLTNKILGIKLTKKAEGTGELEVFFDPTISIEEKIIFSKYIHEHLLQNAKNVVRLRHYVCPHCATPSGNREIAMRKLEEGKKDIPCVNCDSADKRIPLWDEMEALFADEHTVSQVKKLQAETAIVLDNESKERALVGEVMSTVALAGQISREFNVSDHGIDMEIEFKNDKGEATGKKLYLQLKSGDSYLYERKSDGVEVFKIKKERHERYWREQVFPVMLVVRGATGDVRWMEVREVLRTAATGGTLAKQITFVGEKFDVMSVRRWRERILA
jgi:small GTP-binding protein